MELSCRLMVALVVLGGSASGCADDSGDADDSVSDDRDAAAGADLDGGAGGAHVDGGVDGGALDAGPDHGTRPLLRLRGHGVDDRACPRLGAACAPELVYTGEDVLRVRVSDRFLVIVSGSSLLRFDLAAPGSDATDISAEGMPSYQGMDIWDGELVYAQDADVKGLDLHDPDSPPRVLAADITPLAVVVHGGFLHVSTPTGVYRGSVSAGALETEPHGLSNMLLYSDDAGVWATPPMGVEAWTMDPASGDFALAVSGPPETRGGATRFEGAYYMGVSNYGLVRLDGQTWDVAEAGNGDDVRLWTDAAGMYVANIQPGDPRGVSLWPAGGGAPVRVANAVDPDGDALAWTVRTNSTHVYWVQRGGPINRVYRAPKCGCP